MSVENLLVDGTPLWTTSRIIQTWGGVHATPAQRGAGIVIPGRHGVLDDIDRPFAANILSLGLIVRGASDMTGFNDELRALKELVKPGRKVTLTRRLSFTTGTEDHTQQARCLPFTPDMATPADGRIVLNFDLLDGVWYSATEFGFLESGAGIHNVDGDVITSNITLTLPGAGTLTNTSTGTAVQTTGTATIDVLNRTSSAALSGLTITPDDNGNWFTLDPFASNLITWSGGGSADVDYYTAHT